MNQEKSVRVKDLIIESILTAKVAARITEIGGNQNLKTILENRLKSQIAGKCIEEGYIINNDKFNILTFSAGIVRGDQIMYNISYMCDVVHPLNGMILSAKVQTITKAGIHAVIHDDHGNVIIVVFVTRDHNFSEDKFGDIKETDMIQVVVVGFRYELKDPYICVIGEIR